MTQFGCKCCNGVSSQSGLEAVMKDDDNINSNPQPASGSKPVNRGDHGEQVSDMNPDGDAAVITPVGRKTPTSVLIAGLLITVLTIVFLQVDDWGRDWTNNTAETDPVANDLNMRPIETALTPPRLADIVVAAIEEVPRWTIENRTDTGIDMVRLDLVHRTFLLGFKDDVTVEIVSASEEDGATLYAKSQSRIGKGDLGQNPRNIKELISVVRKNMGPKMLKLPKPTR